MRVHSKSRWHGVECGAFTCHSPAVNTIELRSSLDGSVIWVERCRAHTYPRHKLVSGPGPLEAP